MARPNAAQTELLRERLGALWQADHWRCEDELLTLCDTTRDKVDPYIKKWWGKKSLWLDMLATEIGKGIGEAIGLAACIGTGWAATADEWLEGAYQQATEGISCPPHRNILRQKAMRHVEHTLRRAGWRQERPPLMVKHMNVVTVDCESCGRSFSQRLGKCPSCFPRTPPPAKAAEVASAAQEAEAWQKLPSADVEGGLAWQEASRLAWLDGNSGGVFVLQLPSGAVCVKGGACVRGDHFSQRLASALGVRTAAIRVVPQTSDENAAIRSAIWKAASQDEELLMQVMMRLKYSHYDLAVVEFINGCVLMGLPANRLLRPAATAAAPHDTWRQLGRLAAFDMLINNFDRLPLAWTNEGNLGNVMLGSSQGTAVGIDQSVHPISHPDGLEAYLDRVREATGEALHGEGKRFEAVKTAIHTNTGVALAADELQSLRAGCLELLSEVACLAESGELEAKLKAVSHDSLLAFSSAAEAGADDGRQVDAFCKLVRDVASVVQGVLAAVPAAAGAES